MEEIIIRQHFKAPRETVFNALCDHVRFGRITGIPMTVIKPSDTPHAMGTGSVRRVSPVPLPFTSFEETVTEYLPGHRMVYVISRGSPLKNHQGTMVFSDTPDGCALDYRIRFEPRVALPMAGRALKAAIEFPIRRGIEKFARDIAGSEV